MLVRSHYKEILPIHSGSLGVTGELIIPDRAQSLVLFSPGNGDHCVPENRSIAATLHNAGIGTFLFDQPAGEKDEISFDRSDLELLTERLCAATLQLHAYEPSSKLKMGYYGSGTGTASALRAAAGQPDLIHAVVSRGGRVDLVLDIASRIKAPTLLIIGSRDEEALRLNQKMFNVLSCTKALEILPGANHLFEEPGTLSKASKLAANWFSAYL